MMVSKFSSRACGYTRSVSPSISGSGDEPQTAAQPRENLTHERTCHPPKLGSRNILVAFEFDNGWLWLTEAGTQRRAALRVVEGDAGLASLNAGGVEPLDATLAAFSRRTRSTWRRWCAHWCAGSRIFARRALHVFHV